MIRGHKADLVLFVYVGKRRLRNMTCLDQITWYLKPGLCKAD